MSEKIVKFGAVKKIVLATFSDMGELQRREIPCVSAIGKPYGDSYKEHTDYYTIEGIQTNYGMFMHTIRIKDYRASHKLYVDNLNRFGLESLVETLENICTAEASDTVAFIGTSGSRYFDYRYILADYFKDCGAEILEWDAIEPCQPVSQKTMETQRKFWTEDLYLSRGHFNLTDDTAGSVLEGMDWNFAKTMPTNPHFWSVRRDFKQGDEAYLGIVKHIRCFGTMEKFGGLVYRCWDWNGHRYWTCPTDIEDEDCDLINRKVIK